jgi:putative membrane protein
VWSSLRSYRDGRYWHVFCFGAAVWRHLYPGPSPPVPDAARIHPALLILVNAFLALVSITALVGIWFGYAPG